jgi:hypothetical protein
MSDSSYITKLRESQTLVASRFIPRIINPPPIPTQFTLPNGFTITPTSNNTVNVNISGNLNVSGGIDPIFLQLVPQLGENIPFNTSSQGKKGTLWIQTYKDSQQNDQFTLRLDDNIIFNTNNVHLTETIKNINFETLKTNRIAVDFIDATTSNSSGNIQISANLIPSTTNNLTLGTQNNRWADIWTERINAQELNISPNTINVIDDNGNKMSISYDVAKGATFITTNDTTVEAVTTSKNIPGLIDPSFLPFSGLSFASKINISEYKNNIGNSLLDQLLNSIYTLNKSVIQTSFTIPMTTPECDIAKITQTLNGNYYIVVNSNKVTEQIYLPKIKASTNFSTSILQTPLITSPFTIVSEELVDITDGDILIIYYSYIPNGNDTDIIFGFQNINFRLPINSINNGNIIDNTITANKLRNEAITNDKLASSSISLRTLSNEVLNYINGNTRDNNQISSIICLCNDLESKFNKVEKFIKIFALTYFIKDTETDNIITLDNINEIDFQ